MTYRTPVNGKWVLVNRPEELRECDIVKGTTYTNSQKWLMREGYSEFNRVIEGHVSVIKNYETMNGGFKINLTRPLTFEDVIVSTNLLGEVPIIKDPGSSGGFYVQKFIFDSD